MHRAAQYHKIDNPEQYEWIRAEESHTIQGYIHYLAKHPESNYREEAKKRIHYMESLIEDLKNNPYQYSREKMYEIISTKQLSEEDLVDNYGILTHRCFHHIIHYPRLQDEQRFFPLSYTDHSNSIDGNTEIYFFGMHGAGKTCVLVGLMSLIGCDFGLISKHSDNNSRYAMELTRYSRFSMLPPPTDPNHIHVINVQQIYNDGRPHFLSLIEVPDEKISELATGLLSNNNKKILFFVIDPTNEKGSRNGTKGCIKQTDAILRTLTLLSENKSLMRKVVGIHIILTKCDQLEDGTGMDNIERIMTEQGYLPCLQSIKHICQKYDINISTDYNVKLITFSLGKFMPGDVYTFDVTDSRKLSSVIKCDLPCLPFPSPPDISWLKILFN